MTEQEQRIAIAEFCRWVWKPNPKVTHPNKLRFWVAPYMQVFDGCGCPDDEPPDYPHDLNAMHEAENLLSEKQLVWYLVKLTQVRLKQGVCGTIACMMDKTTFATAPQRAEALLRTIGKWKE